MKTIDLNADLGEGQPFDLELLKIVSSASIACGGHAGNEQLMATTLLAAQHAGVITGAHPSFIDKENFGRVRLDIPVDTIAQQVLEQIDIITRIAKGVGQKISYVKLHGALYNLASEDVNLAKNLFFKIKNFDPELKILALDNSAQIDAARDLDMLNIREAFADRAYTNMGNLVSRAKRDAVFFDPKQAVTQAIGIAINKSIFAVDGQQIRSNAQSLCLHGDNEKALVLARAVRDGLLGAGVKIKAFC